MIERRQFLADSAKPNALFDVNYDNRAKINIGNSRAALDENKDALV